MGIYIPRGHEQYVFASLSGRVGQYSWNGDRADKRIFRAIGTWRPEEVKTAELQSKILWAIQPLGTNHWSKLDHKAFWEWVDDYELHT